MSDESSELPPPREKQAQPSKEAKTADELATMILDLRNNPEVARYVVIDDEDDDLDGLPLFQPSSRTGLIQKIVDGAPRLPQWQDTQGCALQPRCPRPAEP